MISLARFTQKASAVNSLIQDVVNALPDNEAAESLENNYDELYSMILGIAETLDCTLSDVEK
ncbi:MULTISPECIES: hypothetical protein [Clostridium]|uniref:Uncharacterized protein n=1 Tax=Clostridium carnis TaxID=1530 RepID=A0ABY6STB7_9CLOT|nr:hypothetical protein [Clostridium carnis]CAI3662205.1 conserved hypothetical protein [Clostridium neonatale]CAI3662735.1 conserved hypothetical protein [Clostridium neonatale]CAI3683028.1 conserved hypothetical protein [Clostridium neonatale]CAI3694446.1 conserved hypothetical protein [Clostridium neonatale]CAI3706913.1 conserved hypothetical protein [Clostridium neonatale]